jgi:hypothetical protein
VFTDDTEVCKLIYMTSTNTFQIGTTYSARSASDHNTIYSFTVIKRTAKFITIEDKWGDVRRAGVWMSGDTERAMPLGKFASAPVIVASRIG